MKENTVLISIIIPCYNDWQYVEQAVYSVLNQTYLDKEIIVVDDGSNTKTKEVLKRLEPKITKLITQENQGQSTARNVGIKASKGKFILVLDSDDFFESTFCEKAIVSFEKDSTVKIVTSFVNRLLLNGKKDVFKPTGGTIQHFLKYNGATGSAMFRKSDWENAGGYDEKMKTGFEDWEFYIRLVKQGGYAFVIQEPLFNYRIKDNSTTTKANKNKITLLQYIYLKHQDLYKSNFETFVNHLLSMLEREEFEKNKNTKRIEFKLGNVILSPYRYFKSLICR
ncbi:glycosyltransferase [Flavobacterium flavipallidum]|uniref:Glycosyltransferase n=1 Tax=Flavobacterium flavipallidum TaxID=3139140 RepID=A0ABU9HJJ7_9FLAO